MLQNMVKEIKTETNIWMPNRFLFTRTDHGLDVTTDPPPIRNVHTAPYKFQSRSFRGSYSSEFREDSLQSNSVQFGASAMAKTENGRRVSMISPLDSKPQLINSHQQLFFSPQFHIAFVLGDVVMF